MRIVMLKDRRPGHYHQAEGVAKALARITPVEVEEIMVHQRSKFVNRYLRRLLSRNLINPSLVLKLAYKNSAKLRADNESLIVSAGGETLLANVCLAKLSVSQNIFIGSTRGIPDRFFSIILQIYERYINRDPYLVTIKPNPIDPDEEGDRLPGPNSLAHGANALLLLGGPTNAYVFEQQDWTGLLAFLEHSSLENGTRWTISCSRRTPESVRLKVKKFSTENPNMVTEYVDYRVAGSGSAEQLMYRSDVIFCTEDSNSMLTESVCSRRHVVSLQPARWSGSDDEKSYLDKLQREGWILRSPIQKLTTVNVWEELQQITPMTENHLDVLAGKFAERLEIS